MYIYIYIYIYNICIYTYTASGIFTPMSPDSYKGLFETSRSNPRKNFLRHCKVAQVTYSSEVFHVLLRKNFMFFLFLKIE